MQLARTIAVLAFVAWGFFAVYGMTGEFPNSEQRSYFVIMPCVMTVIALAFVAAAWRTNKDFAIGCVAGLMTVLLLPYLFFYTGGM